ncbi:hypothetical protein K469DRAFT_587139, partial [Zopfia rhizophila CBS 207.26]
QGLQVVAEGIDPIVKYVCFLGMPFPAQQLTRFEHRRHHGLNGHRDKTWTAGNGVNRLHASFPKTFQTRV